MTAFRYKAVSSSGDVTTGVMEAANAAVVIDRLRREGSIPLRADPAGSVGSFLLSGSLSFRRGARGRLTRADLAGLTRELAIMLGAGLDLDRSLRFIAETATHERLRNVVEAVRDRVRDGSPLAAAMAHEGRSFPRLYLGMVRAGESGGQLAATLDRVAVMLERQRSLAAAITSAMIYPALLLIASIGSIVLLLTKVLPEFVPLFEQNGVALPTPTRILIGLGAAVSSYGLFVLLGLLVLALAARQLFARPDARLRLDRFMLKLPVAGSLLREVLAARLSRALGTLLVNGVPLITALEILRETIGNMAGTAAIELAIASARAGTGLSGLEQAGVLPVRLLHLLRLGQETAQLGQMALRAADIHEEESRIRLERLVSLLVPAITIGLGIAVAGIVSSLLLAMLSLNNLAT